jgi:outer membrane beta-barrel protein
LPNSGEATSAEVAGAKTPTDEVKLKTRWDDIAVLPRRYTLKTKRVEISPTYHFTLNNPLIRHHAVGGQINFFLSEALWLGVEGQYYIPQQTNTSEGSYFLTGAQDKVLPAVNRLVFSGLLDFGYVPAYGKFALFNRAIVHWEGYITAGVGVFESQVIPVKQSDPAFTNLSAIFKVGVGSRLFLTKFMALNAFLTLYGYPDTFEPVANVSYNRDTAGTGCGSKAPTNYYAGLTPGTAAFESAYSDCRKANGNTTLVLDVVFGLGLSFFLPPKFEYKLQR